MSSDTADVALAAAVREALADVLHSQATVRRRRDGTVSISPRIPRPLLVRARGEGLQLLDVSQARHAWRGIFGDSLPARSAEMCDASWRQLRAALRAYGYRA